MGLLQRLGLGRASPPPKINTLLQMISRRAERLDAHQQAETFVSLGGIEHTLLNHDNRVIFGRRGTGKTHVMSFVADAAKKKGEMALLLDLRTIGSNSYIYTDESLSLSERATHLLRDFLSALHDALLDQITAPRSGHDVNRLSPLIDRLGNAVKEVIVRETVERKHVDAGSSESTVGAEGTAKASALLGSLELKGKGEHKQTYSNHILPISSNEHSFRSGITLSKSPLSNKGRVFERGRERRSSASSLAPTPLPT
jgi:hypothetical protein